jgi:EmrB/QacA subfamily drug resistance transporter
MSIAPAATLTPAAAQAGTRRWWALGVLVTAQLMLMLDVTIVNIALPTAQADLGIADADRQWALTAYAVTFGGLLLLGGRVADRMGRRRALLTSLLGFAAASALGGLAWSPETLFAARALQGAFAAVMAPALLSSISLLFPEGPDRYRAFGIYSAVSAAGGAVGLILGGALSEYASWRWCLLVNTPLAILTALAARRLLAGGRSQIRVPYDVPGAVLSTGGSFALVFGVSNAAVHGWTDAITLTALTAATVLAVSFVLVERRAANPLLPLGLLTDRERVGAFVGCLVAFGTNTGATLIVVLYLQQGRGWSALDTGFAFLPFMAGAGLGTIVATRLLATVSARALVGSGFAVAAAGLGLLATISPDSAYSASILPGFVLDGFGVGLLFVPATSLALAGVADADAGIASGTLTATQQLGTAIGAAVANTVAVSAATGRLMAGAEPGVALVHGHRVALVVGAVLMGAGGLLASLLVEHRRPSPGAEAVPHLF